MRVLLVVALFAACSTAVDSGRGAPTGELAASLSQPIEMISYHVDHLGSTALLTNSLGAPVERNPLAPYGEIADGNHHTRYLFTGQEYDEESHLHYFKARYYD